MRTGGMERLAWPSIPPQTGVDPPEGAPARESIRLEPGQVSVQHVAACRIARPIASSLAAGALGWVSWKEGRSPMKRSFYAERDYAFGEHMLTLRNAIGLTQAGLAQLHAERSAGGRPARAIPTLTCSKRC